MSHPTTHSNNCNKKQCSYNSERVIELEAYNKELRQEMSRLNNLLTLRAEDKKVKDAREDRLLVLKGEITHSMSVAMEALSHAIDERHLGK